MSFICVLKCILSSKCNYFLSLLLFALFENQNTAQLYARHFFSKILSVYWVKKSPQGRNKKYKHFPVRVHLYVVKRHRAKKDSKRFIKVMSFLILAYAQIIKKQDNFFSYPALNNNFVFDNSKSQQSNLLLLQFLKFFLRQMYLSNHHLQHHLSLKFYVFL